jgi:hypothetical protein
LLLAQPLEHLRAVAQRVRIVRVRVQRLQHRTSLRAAYMSSTV